MDAKILYFYIFGIISVATAKPARNNADSNYVSNRYELESLLQSLADQGKLEVASNYREDAPNKNRQNRDSSSRYDANPSPLYYKVDTPQYYESDENANDEQPSIGNLQMINQFLKKNDAQDSYNTQSLIEDLLSLDSNNQAQSLKPSEESNNIDQVVALLDELQTISDDGNYRDYRDYDNYRGNDKPKVATQVQSRLSQAKNGVMKLVENLVGNKPQYHTVEYLNLDDDELTGKGRNDNKNTRLRCQGSYCTQTRTADNKKTKLTAKKIKVNDELDAVVLRLSDVDHLLSKLAAPKPQPTKQQKSAQLLQNVNIENLLNSKSSIGNKDNIEAIIFDLTKVENGDAVARQIKQLLTQSDEGSYDEYEEYRNLVENNLKQGIFDFPPKKVATGRMNPKTSQNKKSSNSVYLPRWLLDEVDKKSNGKYNKEQMTRALLPLTRQQVERLNNKNRQNQKAPRVYRRNFDQDVGVPFHMEVQGLGQVIPR